MIVRLLLFFYLGASTLSATHIHHDGISHTDCKVCPIVKNLHSADAPSVAITLVIPLYHDRQVSIAQSVFDYTNIKGFYAQAPPHLS